MDKHSPTGFRFRRSALLEMFFEVDCYAPMNSIKNSIATGRPARMRSSRLQGGPASKALVGGLSAR
jgi:hypothetical protein